MKQKIVIEMSMKNLKSRSKVMKIAFRFSGVEKAALDVPGKDRIEVVGDGVDSVALVVLLRKQFGSAELLSVSSVVEKKPEPPTAKIQPHNHGQDGGAVAPPSYLCYLGNLYPYYTY